MSQWCVNRSSNAVVILASPNTCGHSPKSRFVVIIIDVCSYNWLIGDHRIGRFIKLKQGCQDSHFIVHKEPSAGPKTRPAAVAEQTSRLTWIFFVMFDESCAIWSVRKVKGRLGRNLQRVQTSTSSHGHQCINGETSRFTPTDVTNPRALYAHHDGCLLLGKFVCLHVGDDGVKQGCFELQLLGFTRIVIEVIGIYCQW